MAEISTATTYPVKPLDMYQREQRQEQGKNSDSSARFRSGEGESTESNPRQDRVTLSREAQQISELAATDRRVRSHEAAHSAAGGQYAGSPSYSYRQGPDGKRYAVGGEVPIDVSPVAGNPEATIKKAQIVRAAALAPADPSPQDSQVAAAAMRMELKARTELQTTRRDQLDGDSEESRSESPPSPSKSEQEEKRPLSLYA